MGTAVEVHAQYSLRYQAVVSDMGIADFPAPLSASFSCNEVQCKAMAFLFAVA
jgi:hypothetical protein